MEYQALPRPVPEGEGITSLAGSDSSFSPTIEPTLELRPFFDDRHEPLATFPLSVTPRMSDDRLDESRGSLVDPGSRTPVVSESENNSKTDDHPQMENHASTKNRYVWPWWWETAGIAASAISMAVIIAVLLSIEDRRLNDWPLPDPAQYLGFHMRHSRQVGASRPCSRMHQSDEMAPLHKCGWPFFKPSTALR